MTKEREELLKAANFPFNYPTSTNCPSEQKTKSTPTKHTPKNTRKKKLEKILIQPQLHCQDPLQ
jgi:hypothetical protein